MFLSLIVSFFFPKTGGKLTTVWGGSGGGDGYFPKVIDLNLERFNPHLNPFAC